MPLVPLLLAVGGLVLAVSPFAPWFDVEVIDYSGFAEPSAAAARTAREAYDQTGWDALHGSDVLLLLIGLALAALAIYDAVRHRVPWPVLVAAGVLCAIALGAVLASGFDPPTAFLPEDLLGEGTGQGRLERGVAGGQWVALVGVAAALAGVALGTRERQGATDVEAPEEA